MPVLSLSKIHQPQLEQLTGCKYPVLIRLVSQVRTSLWGLRRGRPFLHSVLEMTVLALMKLRLNLTVRTLEAMTGMDAVTVSRCVNRVLAILSELPLLRRTTHSWLIVDSSSVRVTTTSRKSYSGHKHQKCAKAQVLIQDTGEVADVSPSYLGSVHDKTLWDKELARIAPLLNKLVLADNAYAGAVGEKDLLLRPLKRGETAYKEDKQVAKGYNRGLSKIRVRVEHIFAKMKTWKVLGGIFPFKWQRLGEVMRGIAVLHNWNLELKQGGAF